MKGKTVFNLIGWYLSLSVLCSYLCSCRTTLYMYGANNQLMAFFFLLGHVWWVVVVGGDRILHLWCWNQQHIYIYIYLYNWGRLCILGKKENRQNLLPCNAAGIHQPGMGDNIHPSTHYRQKTYLLTCDVGKFLLFPVWIRQCGGRHYPNVIMSRKRISHVWSFFRLMCK